MVLNMVAFYVMMIKKGLYTVEQVPTWNNYRQLVQEALDAEEGD